MDFWDYFGKFLGILSAMFAAGTLIIFGQHLMGSENIVQETNNAEIIAHCIAEYSYKHPQSDRYEQLMLAVSYCDLSMTRVEGEG